MKLGMEKQKKKINKILSAAVTLLLALSVVLCIFVMSQLFLNGYVKLFGQSFFRVITPSMEPELCVGELICITDQELDTVVVGDIVSFRSIAPETGGLFITHRVVDVAYGENGECFLVTKGDANPSADDYYVSNENYLGTVVWSSGRQSLLSDFLAFFSSKNAFLICIVFPCFLICGFILKDSFGKICKDLEAVRAIEEVEQAPGEGTDENRSAENPEEMDGAEKQASHERNTAEQAEDYEALCRRIREELIEELRQSDEQSKK